MRVLLELPNNNVLKENQDGYLNVLDLYNKNDLLHLYKIPVTKTFSGSIVSHFGDEEWNLTAYVDRKITNKYKITFNEISSQSLANEFKLIFFIWIYTPAGQRRMSPLKPTSLIAIHSKLTQVYKYLDKLKLDSISSLSHPVLFYEFCNYIKELEYSFINAQHIFSVLGKIQKSSKYLPFTFEIPTDQGSSELASEYCSPSKSRSDQFYAMPTSLMEKIYLWCIKFIEELHPHKELLSELASELRLNYTMGKKTIDKKIDSGTWSWLSYDSPNYRIEVNKSKPVAYKLIIESFLIGSPLEKYCIPSVAKTQGWFSKILTACYILCAAFTGMRRNELYGLHSDSFKTRIFNGKTIYTLQSYHHKMTQGRGQLTEWVTSPITGKAIELAEALTRHMRVELLSSPNPMKNHEASCLWINQSKKSEEPKLMYEGHLRTNFDLIAKEAGALIDQQALDEFKRLNPNRNPLNADKKVQVGKVWRITTHQFRRTYAVFVRRHNLCSLTAIKDQFKHLDIPTTDWYGEGSASAALQGIEKDNELKELISSVANEVIIDNVYRWFNSNEKLYGKRGLEIMKERRSIPSGLKTREQIQELVEKGIIDLVGTLHSYCLAGYECRMDKVSSTASCFKCENQLIDEEKAQNWIHRHKWATEQIIYLDSINRLTPSIESHYITQIRATERVMHYFKLPFKKFNFKGSEYE
ncbi:integrase [Pseudoalteromonas galatheae]|uniref:integrase n=1 Tax=Pseudoalteromonas galatheae TaxID=579562 RepID=UPI0030D626AF